MNAPIDTVDENNAGPIIGSVRLHLPPRDAGPHRITQHVRAPRISTITQRYTSMKDCSCAGKEVVFDRIIAEGTVEHEVHRALTVIEPVVLTSHTNAAAHAEA